MLGAFTKHLFASDGLPAIEDRYFREPVDLTGGEPVDLPGKSESSRCRERAGEDFCAFP